MSSGSHLPGSLTLFCQVPVLAPPFSFLSCYPGGLSCYKRSLPVLHTLAPVYLAITATCYLYVTYLRNALQMPRGSMDRGCGPMGTTQVVSKLELRFPGRLPARCVSLPTLLPPPPSPQLTQCQGLVALVEMSITSGPTLKHTAFHL